MELYLQATLLQYGSFYAAESMTLFELQCGDRASVCVLPFPAGREVSAQFGGFLDLTLSQVDRV